MDDAAREAWEDYSRGRVQDELERWIVARRLDDDEPDPAEIASEIAQRSGFLQAQPARTPAHFAGASAVRVMQALRDPVGRVVFQAGDHALGWRRADGTWEVFSLRRAETVELTSDAIATFHLKAERAPGR